MSPAEVSRELAKTPRHPLGIGLDELGEKFADPLIFQRATLIEKFTCTTQVCFRLLHDQHVEENEHLAEMVIGAKPADCAW